jgi:hypothetical protein
MGKLSRVPPAVWLWSLAIVLPAIGAALALPHVGKSLDFASGGHVAGHISDRSLTPIPVIQNDSNAWPLLLAYLTAFGLSCLAYAVVLRVRNLKASHVCGAFLVGVVAMMFVPFYPTSDPYAYALYALEAGPLHLNPYVVQTVAGTGFPWAATLGAMFPDPGSYVRHCNYGPLSAFAYGALAWPLEHTPLPAYLYAERLLGAVCIAATGYALARSAPPELGVRRAAAYVLHPLVLTEFVAFAHGDALMVALLAFAFWAWESNRFGIAAGLCVAALMTRGVAALALVTFFVAVARLHPRKLPVALAGGAAVAFALGGASLFAFGDFSLGGAPAFNRFASPIVYALTATGVPNGLIVGVFGQAALGGILVLILLRRWWREPSSDALLWLPFAALAALPAIYPHYVVWAVAVAALRPGGRYARVARVAAFMAPLWYVARMNLIGPPQPSPLAYALALTIAWGVILFCIASRVGFISRPRPSPLLT